MHMNICTGRTYIEQLFIIIIIIIISCSSHLIISWTVELT